jgi:micrococcal nuclease
MLRILPSLVASLVCIGCAPSDDRCGPASATVVDVVDGDTIVLDSGERVRYLMIDTPEVNGNECFAAEAAQFNTDLVMGKRIELRYDVECTDRYDRLLAYVLVENREVNRLMIERGYACVLHIPPNGADHKTEYEALESQARLEDRGLWGVCETNPC